MDNTNQSGGLGLFQAILLERVDVYDNHPARFQELIALLQCCGIHRHKHVALIARGVHTRNVRSMEKVAVRFSGDSGDGMQLAGNIFTNVSAGLITLKYFMHFLSIKPVQQALLRKQI